MILRDFIRASVAKENKKRLDDGLGNVLLQSYGAAIHRLKMRINNRGGAVKTRGARRDHKSKNNLVLVQYPNV